MMKQTISILIMAVMLSSCGSSDHDKAVDQAKEVQAAIKKNVPGTVPTSTEGIMMRAKIGGKEWTAVSMMPPEASGRIIGYNNGEYIGLPYDKRNLIPGKKIVFQEDDAADLATNDDIGIWGGRKGEMVITKVDDKWAEGTFFFTGSTSRSSETIEVSEGFFRIPIEINK
jgi:hypothetical protein